MRKHVLLYGLLGGVLIAALKLIEYRWLVVELFGRDLRRARGRGVCRRGHLARPQAHAAHGDRGGARGRWSRRRPTSCGMSGKLESLGITPRELEILELIAAGAEQQGDRRRGCIVSENTVKTHSSRVFDKLGARRRTQAVQLGKELRLIPYDLRPTFGMISAARFLGPKSSFRVTRGGEGRLLESAVLNPWSCHAKDRADLRAHRGRHPVGDDAHRACRSRTRSASTGALIVGYTSMVLAFLMVFFGVRSYRDNVAGGTRDVRPGLQVGLADHGGRQVCYVATWEVIYYKLTPDFTDKYAAYAVEKAKKSGATEAQIAAKDEEMAEFKEMYRNPLVNIALHAARAAAGGAAVHAGDGRRC